MAAALLACLSRYGMQGNVLWRRQQRCSYAGVHARQISTAGAGSCSWRYYQPAVASAGMHGVRLNIMAAALLASLLADASACCLDMVATLHWLESGDNLPQGGRGMPATRTCHVALTLA